MPIYNLFSMLILGIEVKKIAIFVGNKNIELYLFIFLQILFSLFFDLIFNINFELHIYFNELILSGDY